MDKPLGLLLISVGFVLMLACVYVMQSIGNTPAQIGCEVWAGFNGAMFILWLIKPSRRD